MIYIFWSCRNTTEAKKIIHLLLDQQLIACASLFPEVTSIYSWEGAITESQEVKVLLKTTAKHFDPIQSIIHIHSSYQVPEIVEINPARVNPSYLSWITEICNNNFKK